MQLRNANKKFSLFAFEFRRAVLFPKDITFIKCSYVKLMLLRYRSEMNQKSDIILTAHASQFEGLLQKNHQAQISLAYQVRLIHDEQPQVLSSLTAIPTISQHQELLLQSDSQIANSHQSSELQVAKEQ